MPVFKKIHFRTVAFRRLLAISLAISLLLFGWFIAKDPLQRWLFGVRRGVVFLGVPMEGKLRSEVIIHVRYASRIYRRLPQDALFDPDNYKVQPALNGYYVDFEKTVENLMNAPSNTVVKPVFCEEEPLLSLADYPAVPVNRGHPDKKQIALIFLMNTDTENIDGVLAALSALGGKGNFFFPPETFVQARELINMLSRGGHGIGLLFSYEALADTPVGELERDILRRRAVLQQLTGVSPCYFTTEEANCGKLLLEVSALQGLRAVFWSTTIEEIVSLPDEEKREKEIGGAIIRAQPTEESVAQGMEIFSRYKKQGYAFVNIAQLLDPSPFSGGVVRID